MCGLLMGTLLGARGQNVGPSHALLGPGAKMWGPFMGTLLGAKGRNVGSFHADSVGGQGPKCGVLLWGHCWEPGAQMWGHFIGTACPLLHVTITSVHCSSSDPNLEDNVLG